MTSYSGFSYPRNTTSHPFLRCYGGSIPLALWTIATDSLAERDLSLTDEGQLELIIRAGLEAQANFFAAVTHDPTQQELDLFFMDFVVRCVKTETR